MLEMSFFFLSNLLPFWTKIGTANGGGSINCNPPEPTQTNLVNQYHMCPFRVASASSSCAQTNAGTKNHIAELNWHVLTFSFIQNLLYSAPRCVQGGVAPLRA
jgi:hypothetical protein